MSYARITCAVLALLLTTAIDAAELQSLTALVDGKPFESDDGGITFIPVMGNFSLSASTKGASAWPPPTTRIDRLGIVCRPFEAGEARTYDSVAFANSGCDVTFDVGTKPMGGDPDASFGLDKDSTDNRLVIERADGKVIEGRFQFDLKSEDGTVMQVRDGRFTAEDRQY